jgi:hypothetical protein
MEKEDNWNIQLRFRNNSNVLSLLQPIDLHPDTHHPMVPLGSAPSFENDGSPRYAKFRQVLQPLSLAPAFLFLIGAKPISPQPMPDDKASHRIFISGSPSIFKIQTGQGVVAGMIAVKGLVLIEEVAIGEKAAVQIAVGKIEYRHASMVNMWDFFARSLTQRTLENEKLAIAEDDTAA